jgi:hypothetical protein
MEISLFCKGNPLWSFGVPAWSWAPIRPTLSGLDPGEQGKWRAPLILMAV